MPSAKARAAKCRPHTFFHPPVLYMLAPVVFHSPPAVHASANRSASRDAHKDTPATSAAASAPARASAALPAPPAPHPAPPAPSPRPPAPHPPPPAPLPPPPPSICFSFSPRRRPLRRPRRLFPHRRQRRQHRHRQFIFFHFSPPQIS